MVVIDVSVALGLCLCKHLHELHLKGCKYFEAVASVC